MATSPEVLCDRIARFRGASRIRGQNQPPCPYLRDLAEAHSRDAHLPWRIRQAGARAHALERMPVYLFPDEWLVGMVYHCGPEPDGANPTDYRAFGAKCVPDALPENRVLVNLGLCSDGASPGHVTWRWDWMLEKGVLGLLADCRKALADPPDEMAADFYDGVSLSLEALVRWNARHVEALREALANSSGAEAVRLRECLAVSERGRCRVCCGPAAGTRLRLHSACV